MFKIVEFNKFGKAIANHTDVPAEKAQKAISIFLADNKTVKVAVFENGKFVGEIYAD